MHTSGRVSQAKDSYWPLWYVGVLCIESTAWRSRGRFVARTSPSGAADHRRRHREARGPSPRRRRPTNRLPSTLAPQAAFELRRLSTGDMSAGEFLQVFAEVDSRQLIRNPGRASGLPHRRQRRSESPRMSMPDPADEYR